MKNKNADKNTDDSNIVRNNKLIEIFRILSLVFVSLGFGSITILMLRRFPEGTYYIALFTRTNQVDSFAKIAYICFVISVSFLAGQFIVKKLDRGK